MKQETSQASTMASPSADLLPAEWTRSAVDDIIVSRSPGYWGDSEPSQDRDVQVQVIRNGDIDDSGRIRSSARRFFSSAEAKRSELMAGDTLLTISGQIGKAVFVQESGTSMRPSNFLRSLRPNAGAVDPLFLYFSLLSPATSELLETYSHGSTIRNLKTDFFKVKYLPLPPLPEQRAIAALLRVVRQAQSASEAVRATTSKFRTSLMHHLFTYGPDHFVGADPVPLRETDFGAVPQAWNVVAMKQVADIDYGVQAAVAHLTDSAKGIPILTNVNINSEGALDLSILRYYGVPDAKRERFILRKEDVLFNWRSGSQGHVGKTAVFMLVGEYTYSSFILRIRCKGEIRPLFLTKYLHLLRARGYFARKRQQSSVNSVFNKSVAETIPIVLPPLKVQDEIVDQLAAVDAKLMAEDKYGTALARLFHSLLSDLLTGRRRAVHPKVA